LVASGADTFVKKTLAETGAILEGDISHDNLVDFVANEHIDHTGVTLTAGDGLTGGGDISANRTFAVGAGTAITVNANDVQLDHLGIESLADPGADRIMFWDDSDTATEWLVPNTGLAISVNNLNVTADYSVITANDGATDVTAAELEELTDGSATTLHKHDIIEEGNSKVEVIDAGAGEITIVADGTEVAEFKVGTQWIGEAADTLVSISQSAHTITGIAGGETVYRGVNGVGSNSCAELYNDQNKKLETKSYGLEVTGDIYAPSACCFLALATGNQANVAINTVHTIQYNSEIYDQGADYNNGTYTFTAPLTGRYLLTYQLYFEDLDTAAAYAWGIITSNRTYSGVDTRLYTADNDADTWTLSVIADMDASDTAYCYFYQAGGAAQCDLNVNNNDRSFFSGHMLC
jgi:hypothetical protein